MSKKEFRLTNWQVPTNPSQAQYDALKKAPEIDLEQYKNMGKVEHHESVQSVAEKMIQKREATTGQRVNAVEVKAPLNYAGVNDDRGGRKFFIFGKKSR